MTDKPVKNLLGLFLIIALLVTSFGCRSDVKPSPNPEPITPNTPAEQVLTPPPETMTQPNSTLTLPTPTPVSPPTPVPVVTPTPKANEIEWSKIFSGTGDALASSVRQTSDGGYIMAGFVVSSTLNQDVYLVKTDSSGKSLWTKTYGGKKDDTANSVQQTSDGGFIIAGQTFSFSSTFDAYLIKTDSLGSMQWTKTYDSGNNESFYSVQQTSDGGFIMVGDIDVNGDIYLVKTDASGNMLWSKNIGGKGSDRAYSVQQTIDSGYIIAGSTNSSGAGGSDAYLVKTDSLGIVQWEKTYGGKGYDRASSGQQTTDGGYIIAGSTNSSGFGGNDVYLVKTDSSGNMVWSKTFGGNNTDRANSVQQTSDGGYILAGQTDSFGAGNFGPYVVKTNSSGTILWSRYISVNGTGSASSVQQTADGGYIIAGYRTSIGIAGRSDFYLVYLPQKNVSSEPVPVPVPVPPKPAAFTTSRLTITPNIVKSWETVRVSITITNTGGQAGVYTAVLKVENNTTKTQDIQTQNVTIASGSTRIVDFDIIPGGVGTYSATIGLETDTFYVMGSAPPSLLLKWGMAGSGNGQFNDIIGIAVDSSSNVYVADRGNNRIQKFNSSGQFVTKWGTNGSGDGQFNVITGVAVDSSGNVYVVEAQNKRIQKFNSSGQFITKWSTIASGDSQFVVPIGVTVDSLGNVYVNSGNYIQKFTSNGTFITKWVATTSGLISGKLSTADSLAVDSLGNMLVLGDGIKKFTSDCVFITRFPISGGEIAMDSLDNLYVTTGNSVQKYASSGQLITQWGTLGSGDGQFNLPSHLTVDSLGRVYVVDYRNNRIEVFSQP